MKQPSPNEDPKTIGAFLESIVNLCWDVINEQDYKFSSPAGLVVLAHTSQDARLFLDNFSVQGRTFEEHMAMFAEWAHSLPRPPHSATKTVTAQVDEDKRSAVVYTQTMMQGVEDGCEVPAFMEHSWRLEHDNVYRIWMYRRMRSPPGALGDGI